MTARLDAWGLITDYVQKRQATNPHRKLDPLVARYERIVAYGKQSLENQQRLDKAFKAIAKYAVNEDSILTLFLCWPDKAELEVFPMIYGRRGKTPDAERDHYVKIKKLAENLRREIMKPHKGVFYDAHETSIYHMHTDLGSDPLASDDLTRDLYYLPRLLRQLILVAETADPFRKYLTAQPNADDASKQSYIAQLAMLNDARRLSKPQHAAIATIAMANYPKIQVDRRVLEAAYRRISHDPSGKGLLKYLKNGD